MEESRTQRLQQLLKRLGQAVHGTVIQSKEVRACLEELHDDGWRAVMLLEASLVCRDNGILESDEGSIHIHVDPSEATVNYRIDSLDARFLSSLGISPSRHRSLKTTPRREADEQSDRQDS
jgi:hypothetical protein